VPSPSTMLRERVEKDLDSYQWDNRMFTSNDTRTMIMKAERSIEDLYRASYGIDVISL